mgnify:CR=1 FL=1
MNERIKEEGYSFADLIDETHLEFFIGFYMETLHEYPQVLPNMLCLDKLLNLFESLRNQPMIFIHELLSVASLYNILNDLPIYLRGNAESLINRLLDEVIAVAREEGWEIDISGDKLKYNECREEKLVYKF